MNNTYSLEQLEIICRDDIETEAVHQALKLALHRYQWQYQNASDKQFRDVDKTNMKALTITMEWLKNCGYESLADEIDAALLKDGNTLTKSKFLTEAKKVMKRSATKTINESKYNRNFATLMREAFIEQCEEYPLKEVPRDIQEEFDKEPYYQDQYDYYAQK